MWLWNSMRHSDPHDQQQRKCSMDGPRGIWRQVWVAFQVVEGLWIPALSVVFLTQKCSHVSSYCMTCRNTLSITSIKWSCPHHCMCSFLRPTLFCHLSPQRQLSAPSIEALSLDSSAAALLSCFIDGCLPSIVRRWMGWCWWLYFP